MTEYQSWYQDKQIERTLNALKKNNFDARFVQKGSDALEEIFKIIPNGATVGVGGSLTLNQIGFFDEARTKPIVLMNSAVPGITQEEAFKMRREMLLADYYLSSSNAITEDGHIYNIDSNGNRVGAMMFGPKHVLLVCGVNKIVKDIEAAKKRVQEWIAPMNARRLGLKTPCADTGVCVNCSSQQRICNIYVILSKKPRNTDITVFIVGEQLGF